MFNKNFKKNEKVYVLHGSLSIGLGRFESYRSSYTHEIACVIEFENGVLTNHNENAVFRNMSDAMECKIKILRERIENDGILMEKTKREIKKKEEEIESIKQQMQKEEDKEKGVFRTCIGEPKWTYMQIRDDETLKKGLVRIDAQNTMNLFSVVLTKEGALEFAEQVKRAAMRE